MFGSADSALPLTITDDSDYNSLRCLGELDGILIYSMSTNKLFSSFQVSAPETDYLRNIY